MDIFVATAISYQIGLFSMADIILPTAEDKEATHV